MTAVDKIFVKLSWFRAFQYLMNYKKLNNLRGSDAFSSNIQVALKLNTM